jgi:hypothetical protein
VHHQPGTNRWLRFEEPDERLLGFEPTYVAGFIEITSSMTLPSAAANQLVLPSILRHDTGGDHTVGSALNLQNMTQYLL